MRRPGWTGNQVAVDDGAGDVDGDISGAGEFHFRRAGGIGIELSPFEYTGGSEQLWTVAESGNGLVGLGKVTNDVEDLGIETQVLRSATAGDDKAIVLRRIEVVEGGVEREVVASFFGVGLVAFEVVDRAADLIAFFLAGADGVHGVANHLQGLERHHDLVVLDEIAGEQEKFCGFHEVNSSAPSLPQGDELRRARLFEFAGQSDGARILLKKPAVHRE